ncbi:hypothetical protein A6A25_30830 [Saccharothrix sp. CB00851]|nr:hypothetical protein A6A25_30830 [Saccharothrix sp. CB00851]
MTDRDTAVGVSLSVTPGAIARTLRAEPDVAVIVKVAARALVVATNRDRVPTPVDVADHTRHARIAVPAELLRRSRIPTVPIPVELGEHLVDTKRSASSP